MELGNYGPALPSSHPFTGVETYYYWSSTTIVDYPGFAWYVDLGNGSVRYGGYKSYTYYVWPVRG